MISTAEKLAFLGSSAICQYLPGEISVVILTSLGLINFLGTKQSWIPNISIIALKEMAV